MPELYEGASPKKRYRIYRGVISLLDSKIILYGFRYCLASSGDAVSSCSSYLIQNWEELTIKHRNLIVREIQVAIDAGLVGDASDIRRWRAVVEAASEEWRPVVGWEGLYEVSSWGRLRTLGHRNPKQIRKVIGTQPNDWGYPTVRLSRHHKRHTYTVHRLVAAAFLGPRPEGNWCVNHKDGNKSNNRLDNLEYVTQRDNQLHAIAMGLKVAKPIPQKISKEIALAIKASPRHVTGKVLAEKYGLTPSYVNKIRRGENWKHVA